MTRKGVLGKDSFSSLGVHHHPPNSPGPEGGLPQLRPLPESARILCPHEWVRVLRLRSVASELWAVGEAGSKRTEG